MSFLNDILLGVLFASVGILIYGLVSGIYLLCTSNSFEQEGGGEVERLVLACSSCGYPIEKKQINLLTDNETFEYCVMCGETRVFTRKE